MPGEVVRSFGMRIVECCEPSCRNQELNLSPLGKTSPRRAVSIEDFSLFDVRFQVAHFLQDTFNMGSS